MLIVVVTVVSDGGSIANRSDFQGGGIVDRDFIMSRGAIGCQRCIVTLVLAHDTLGRHSMAEVACGSRRQQGAQSYDLKIR